MAELSRGRSYAALIGSRIRAQVTYRSSFAVNAVTAFFVGVVEFLELYVLVANVPALGGLTIGQLALVFALANLSFSVADLVAGQLDQINHYLRAGRLEAFLVRPMPLMAQMITADFQLRRAGRSVFALAVLVVVLAREPIDVTPATGYLLGMALVAGAAIYAALFVLAGGIQFWLIEGSEFTNAFVYGGSYAGQLPGSTLLPPLRLLFTFVVPVTVTAYLPALLILGLPGPALLPAWLGWFQPLFAVWVWLLAWLVWRTGMRHFSGAGG